MSDFGNFQFGISPFGAPPPPGSQTDITRRFKSAIPNGWFPSAGSNQVSPTPVLDGIASGFAAVGAWAYTLIQYVKAQTRLATMSGGSLAIAPLLGGIIVWEASKATNFSPGSATSHERG